MFELWVFSSLAMHWYHESCPYPELGSRRREILTGLLLGDGSIPEVPGNHSFRLPMINRRFLEWFNERMEYLTTGVRLRSHRGETRRRQS